MVIPSSRIDHARARGGLAQDEQTPDPHVSWLSVLFTCRPLLVLAVCAALFHFANAPMLHLVGQKLALANTGRETAFMSACVIAAQLVMLPMALFVGAKADTWGRKPFCGAHRIAAAGSSLHRLRQLGLAGDCPAARRYWQRIIRNPHRYRCRRPNAGYGPVQSRARRRRYGAGGRCLCQQCCRGRNGRLGRGYNAAFLSLASIAALGLVVLSTLLPETGPQDASGRRTSPTPAAA